MIKQVGGNSTVESQNTSGNVRRGEFMLAFAFLIAAILLRVVYIFHFRVNSDEPQHLHVVWAWTQGLLPYRDVFDNHTPLFQLLCSPFFGLIGENARIVAWMRLLELPCYLLTLWLVYLIAKPIFGGRVGLWAIVFAGLYPYFFFCSLEFRPDGFWALCWLIAIAILLRGTHLTPLRCFFAGFMFGMDMDVSMKTILLVGALGSGALAVLFIGHNKDLKSVLKWLTPRIVTATLGFLILPLLTVGFYAYKGALNPFYYGIIGHNLLAETASPVSFWIRLALFSLGLLIVSVGAMLVYRRGPDVWTSNRRVLIFVTAAMFILILEGFWPLIQREHYLPFYPLLFILLAPVILSFGDRMIGIRAPALMLPVFVSVLEFSWLLTAKPWQDNLQLEAKILSTVLRLTNPSDYILDAKGECIFRQRPCFFVYERITKKATAEGRIPDDVVESLIKTDTCVTLVNASRFSQRTEEFLDENYLKVGHLRVAGKFLHPQPASAKISFDLKITARYEIVAAEGSVGGLLDGTPYDGPRLLGAGPHEFTPQNGAKPLAVIWAQAPERGFSPFQAQAN